MNTSKSIQLMGALALASLIHFSPATAQDPETGETTLGHEQEIPGATIDPKFLEVSSQHVAVLSRRLENAEALGDIEASIDEIRRVIQDLLDERQAWFNHRQNIANYLDKVRRDIRDVSDDIDDIEVAIAVSMAATAGIPNPELVATRTALVARKNRLKGERERSENDLRVADQTIALIQAKIDDANARLAEKQEEKRQLQKHIARVSLIAPSHGARLLVDSSEELRISSDQPPEQVVIEVQEFVTRGGSSPEDPIRQSWETVYHRNLEWKNLASAGPGAVSLAFKTGTRPQFRSMPIIGLEAFWLDRGEYRARVGRVGAEAEGIGSSLGGAAGSSGSGDVEQMRKDRGSSGSGEQIEWRRFTVVGRLGSEALGKRDPVPESGGSKFQYRPQQIKPGAVLRPTEPKEEKEEEDEPPSLR